MPYPTPVVDRDLLYHRIDPSVHGSLAYANYRETCIESFGSARRCLNEADYLTWLAKRVEEYPEGHVLIRLRDQWVGQLELQTPYGSDRGYVNLFHVAKPWRRLGMGRRLHDFAMTYFRSWEARWIELHVSPTNHAAMAFYRSQGYRLATVEHAGERMWRMEMKVRR